MASAKHVLITGGAGNLGMAVTSKFLADGWQVTVIAQPGTGQEDTLNDLQNPHLSVIAADLADEQAAAEAVDQAAAEGLDAAVMLVGGFAMGGIADTAAEDIDAMYRLNFLTAYNIAKPAFAAMKNLGEGGKLIFTGARPALDAAAGKGTLAYSLSKGMVMHLAALLNEEGKEDNIVSGVIVPSIIDTPPNREGMPDADFSTWVKPEEIAEVIAFACSGHGNVLREPVYKVYGKA